MLRTVGGLLGALALIAGGRMVAAPAEPPPPAVEAEATQAAMPAPSAELGNAQALPGGQGMPSPSGEAPAPRGG